MSNAINSAALAIFEGMACVCDCDASDAEPSDHDADCGIRSAWDDAVDAANERASGSVFALYEEVSMFEDDPMYSPFEGDDADWLDY